MAAAGVRTTKGLYFTFTLLCLVCLASSLVDKDQLEKLKDNLQSTQHKLDSMKAKHKSDMAPSLGHMNEYMNIMDQLEALVKKTDLPDDFPLLEGFLQNLKGFMENTKTYIEREKEAKLDAEIEKTVEEIGKMKKFVEFLEENQAEL